jgi:hypothetical protein
MENQNEPTPAVGYKKGKVSRSFSGLLACLTILVLQACSSSADNVNTSRKDLERAEHELEIAQMQYARDVAIFRDNANKKLVVIEKEISLLKMRYELNEADAGPDYEKRILLLTQRKDALKMKISEYRADSRDSWASFQTEFKEDIDALGVALKDFNKPD